MTEHRGIIELSEMHCFTAGYRTIHLRFLLLLRRRSSSTRTELITTVFFFLFPHKKKTKTKEQKFYVVLSFLENRKAFFGDWEVGNMGGKWGKDRAIDKNTKRKYSFDWCCGDRVQTKPLKPSMAVIYILFYYFINILKLINK